MASMKYTEYLLKKENELLEKKDTLSYEKSKKEFELFQIEKKILYIDKTLLKIELEKVMYKKYKREEIISYLKNLLSVAAAGLFVDLPAHIFDDKLLGDNMVKGLDILAAILVVSGTGFLTFDLCYEINDYKKEQFINADRYTVTELKDEKLYLMHQHDEVENEIQNIRIKLYRVLAELDQNYI